MMKYLFGFILNRIGYRGIPPVECLRSYHVELPRLMHTVVNQKVSNRVALILPITLETTNVMITDRFYRKFSFYDLFGCALLMMMSERVGSIINSKGSHLEKRPILSGFTGKSPIRSITDIWKR